MTIMTETETLTRFHFAQNRQGTYRRALREIQRGNKKTHWMWFIFPQHRGLARSETARTFGIDGRAEALAYLNDPVLRVRLAECTMAALNHDKLMFSYPDNDKLRSCMTLFRAVAADPALPDAVLEKFYGGKPDQNTLDLLAGKPVTLVSRRLKEGGIVAKHWDKEITRARAEVAAAGRQVQREPWTRDRVTSFVRGFGLSTVATRQLVDAWMTDQAKARREGWEDGHEAGIDDSAYYGG